MECHKNCSFQEFKDDKFLCSYYNAELPIEIQNNRITIHRCEYCRVEESEIRNEESYLLKGIRTAVTYLGDHFYSFKDEFEKDLADLYRNLKELEEIVRNKEGEKNV